MTIEDALEWVRLALTKQDISDSPSLDAQCLLEKVSGHHRPYLLTHPEQELSPSEAETLREMTARLVSGEPLPYVLREWSFYGITFHLTPDVLIPRPETEMLVETAVHWLEANPHASLAADIGTGSGCIALSILHALPDRKLRFQATDYSHPAIAVAKQNAIRLNLENRIQFLYGDLAKPLSDPISICCANLPYIPSQRCQQLEVASHEPLLALDGGPDGFSLYRELFADIQSKMAPNGIILCEIEYSQKKIALEVARTFFPDAIVTVTNDLSGMPRLLSIQLTKS